MKNYFITGIPISRKLKLLIMLFSGLLMVINHILPIITTINYVNRDYVTLFLLGVFVLFSIGDIVTETILIGIILFGVLSCIWDLSVYDVSNFRLSVLFWGLVILFVGIFFGKVSIFNLIQILKRQFGAR